MIYLQDQISKFPSEHEFVKNFVTEIERIQFADSVQPNQTVQDNTKVKVIAKKE